MNLVKVKVCINIKGICTRLRRVLVLTQLAVATHIQALACIRMGSNSLTYGPLENNLFESIVDKKR